MTEPVSIADCLKRAAELQASDSARLDLELMLAQVLDKPRSYLYTWPEKNLSAEQLQRFEAWLARRRAGEPIAQILGRKEFWSLDLKVDDSTLIPRPDTELLVECALAQLPSTHCRVLDLGTGTGAIALALASERPLWQLLAVDNSPAALRLAIENCRALGLTNVGIARSNWFSNVPPQQFDLIVSNPPYIDPDDPHLEQGDLRFEPRSALVAEDEGLADLRHIIGTAPAYLSAKGWLLLEHGFEQGAVVRGLLAERGYRLVRTCQDLAGRDRVSMGQAPGEAK